ncbi:MerR family transcriptional regulator [soil metagenome]
MSATTAPDEMTIDELARTAEVVVSTVRLYQNKGLLNPPTKRGRVGYYDAAHLARLRLIAHLQERGFSLASIKELFEGMERGESLRTVLGLGDAPSTWTPEEHQRMPIGDLAGFLPQVAFTPAMVARVMGLGLVDFAEDTTEVVVRSPSFLRIGSQLAALGVPPEVILEEYEALREHATVIAGRFTDVFRDHLWEPFVEDGMTAERTGELVGALEELGPLAEAVVVVALRHAIQDLADTFISAEAERLGVEIPHPGHST